MLIFGRGPLGLTWHTLTLTSTRSTVGLGFHGLSKVVFFYRSFPKVSCPMKMALSKAFRKAVLLGASECF